ncbi:MAG: outer membrane lipoprotein-sorting protein [Sulfurimonas sp.]|jgi:outer membrane lipoprotein-sorting protein|uniref:hypothetical protein n=1 Tax=Sulfurimonas sp. TaxID=2022749 RepID=UPI0039E70B6A
MLRISIKIGALFILILLLSACATKSQDTLVKPDDTTANISEGYENITSFASFQSTPNTPPPSIISDIKKLKPSPFNTII